MNRERTQGLLAGLILLSPIGLVMPDARAGATSGQLGVGIVILDTCHMTTSSGSESHGPVEGLDLRCTKGTYYTVHAAPIASRQEMVAAAYTTVTVDF